MPLRLAPADSLQTDSHRISAGLSALVGTRLLLLLLLLSLCLPVVPLPHTSHLQLEALFCGPVVVTSDPCLRLHEVIVPLVLFSDGGKLQSQSLI